MLPALRRAALVAHGAASGPPLSGVRLVVPLFFPLVPFLFPHGTHVEVGFQGGRFAVRIVRPGQSPGDGGTAWPVELVGGPMPDAEYATWSDAETVPTTHLP